MYLLNLEYTYKLECFFKMVDQLLCAGIVGDDPFVLEATVPLKIVRTAWGDVEYV